MADIDSISPIFFYICLIGPQRLIRYFCGKATAFCLTGHWLTIERMTFGNAAHIARNSDSNSANADIISAAEAKTGGK